MKTVFIKKAIEDESTGVVCNLHRLSHLSIDFENGFVTGSFAGYFNDAAVKNNKRPIMSTTYSARADASRLADPVAGVVAMAVAAQHKDADPVYTAAFVGGQVVTVSIPQPVAEAGAETEAEAEAAS